jgi:hypothetical protein
VELQNGDPQAGERIRDRRTAGLTLDEDDYAEERARRECATVVGEEGVGYAQID